MRDIKFRIFDADIPNDLAEVDLDQPSGQIVDWEYVRRSDYLFHALNGEYPLMQYTGLKDKNGKEVYEGDILKIDYLVGDGAYINSVSYSKHGEWDIGAKRLSMTYHRSEVIGNIYENPELLEQTNG